MKYSIKTLVTYSSIPVLAVALVAALATSQAQAATTPTTISSTIGSIISVLTSSGTVNLSSTPTPTGVQTIASDTITISTNNSSGYNLKFAETGAATALTSGGNTIPATSATFSVPAALTVNTWGYRVDGLGTFGAGPTSAATNAAIGSITFAAVPATASPQTLKTTATTATSDVTTIWYGLAVNTSTPSGTFTNSVTYTAVTN